MEHHQMLLEQQKELMLPLAVNGFSADQHESGEAEEIPVARHLQQGRRNQRESAISRPERLPAKEQLEEQPQQADRQTEQDPMSGEQRVRLAWEQRAKEVSWLLGETLTAEDLAAFFAVPRDTDGQPLKINGEAEDGESDEAIAGQQAPWYAAQYQLQALQQQQSPLAQVPSAISPRPPPVLNGSLAKRLARLFAGVSYAFTPEDQQANFSSAFGGPMYGFPSAVPPPLPPTLAAAALGGGVPSSYASSVFGNGINAQAMQLQQQEQLAAQLQWLRQQQQYQQQQYRQGYSPFDSALEAMEASAGGGAAGESARLDNASDDDGGELEGLFFPGVSGSSTNPLQLMGHQSSYPIGAVGSLGAPPFSLQQPPVPPRLPPVVTPLGPVPPMGTVPLGGSPVVPLPSIPPVAPLPPFNPPVVPLPGVPNRLPPEYKGGCWVDRCCASVCQECERLPHLSLTILLIRFRLPNRRACCRPVGSHRV